MRFKLFCIVTPAYGSTFVVAENASIAADIFVTASPLAEGEEDVFKIMPWDAELAPMQRRNLDGFLEFGPHGVAAFHPQSGWSVRPPG